MREASITLHLVKRLARMACRPLRHRENGSGVQVNFEDAANDP
jgi:hypothetical protein